MKPEADAASPEGRPRGTGRRPGGARFSGFVKLTEAGVLPALTVLVILVFSFLPSTSEVFPTTANFQAIAGNQAILAIAAAAVLVPLICGEFDLSIGAIVGLSSVVSASVMSSGSPLSIAILVALGTGAAAGAVNGLLVTRAHISAVVVTLGTSVIFGGLIQAKTHGESIVSGISPELTKFGSGLTFGVPTVVLATIALAGLLHYLLVYTPFGRHLYMLGDNRSAARLLGLRNDRLLFSSFVMAGLIAGVAGILQVGRLGSAAPTSGVNLTLPALAAAFLSAAAIKPGRFNVWGMLAAIAFLASLTGGLNIAGTETYVADFVNGAALIAGVALAVFIGRRNDPDRTL